MMCKKCEELEKEYLRKNPDWRGWALCIKCFEESLVHTVYVNMPYQQKEGETNGSQTISL